MSLQAVIFDVDGVLVRSMEKHYEAYRHVFAGVGVDIRPEEVYANEGRRSREVIESLAADRQLALAPEKLEEMNRAKQAKFLSFGPLPFYEGAKDLVLRLRASGLKVAAVTGTNRQNVENHFGSFTGEFDVIVTSDDVKRTKPDPEPYLAALRKLGVSPSDAMVVENAPLGIRSAKAAGLRVVAITTTNPPGALREADRVVPDVQEVWSVMEAWR